MLKREEITDKELRQIANQRKAEEKNKRLKEMELQKTKEKKLIEFSKKIMFFVMATAFVVIVFAMYIIAKTMNTTYLDILIIETMNFAKIGVGFYSAKAAVENYQKIKNTNNLKQLQIQEFIDNLEKNENIEKREEERI